MAGQIVEHLYGIAGGTDPAIGSGHGGSNVQPGTFVPEQFRPDGERFIQHQRGMIIHMTLYHGGAHIDIGIILESKPDFLHQFGMSRLKKTGIVSVPCDRHGIHFTERKTPLHFYCDRFRHTRFRAEIMFAPSFFHRVTNLALIRQAGSPSERISACTQIGSFSMSRIFIRQVPVISASRGFRKRH